MRWMFTDFFIKIPDFLKFSSNKTLSKLNCEKDNVWHFYQALSNFGLSTILLWTKLRKKVLFTCKTGTGSCGWHPRYICRSPCTRSPGSCENVRPCCQLPTRFSGQLKNFQQEDCIFSGSTRHPKSWEKRGGKIGCHIVIHTVELLQRLLKTSEIKIGKMTFAVVN